MPRERFPVQVLTFKKRTRRPEAVNIGTYNLHESKINGTPNPDAPAYRLGT
jgi:hypothetical protein